jgi:hypothetical protein
MYGVDPRGFGSAYHVLARDRNQAAGLRAMSAVIAVRVPDNERADYLTCPNGSCFCRGELSGPLKPPPPSMICGVEYA